MKKFVFLVLFFTSNILFAKSSPTIIELKSANDALNFVSSGAEGAATSGMLYQASNKLCMTTTPAHGYPVPIPELKTRLVGFNFSEKSLETPTGAGGGFCRYTPISAVVYLTVTGSDTSPLVAQLEIYNSTDKRAIEIFCKINVEYGKEFLRCRNANEPYPQSASRIFLNLSEGTSTIKVHQE